VQYLIAALDRVLGRYNVNRKQMTLAGFSDGATYALSLGLVGNIFSHVIAYSPGGFVPPEPEVSKG
jgi:phospholipase/carboxylesterase